MGRSMSVARRCGATHTASATSALCSLRFRLPIAPPPDYDAKHYELVARFIAACENIGDRMDLRWFSKFDPLPSDKWDFNTATFGGNLPGASWEWPDASYDRRVEIAIFRDYPFKGEAAP